MKINKYIFLLLSSLIFVVTSCHSGGHGHSHSHSHGQEGKEEHDHEHEEGHKKIAEISLKQMQTVGITFGQLEKKALNETIHANGVLHLPSSSKAVLTSLYGGEIKTVKMHSGDKVRKGQTLAKIISPELVQLQGEYWSVKGDVALMKKECKRQQKLRLKGGSSEKFLQKVKNDLSTLEVRLASIQSKLLLMGINVKKMKEGKLLIEVPLKAPISGVISNVHVRLGSYVEASSPIVEIVDNKGLHLELSIYEQDLSKIRLGQLIHFTLTNNPGKEYDAKVYSIGSSFEKDTHTIAVHCKLKEKDDYFIDGMSIRGIVSLGSELATYVVPQEAIVHVEGKDFVYMLVPNDEEHKEEEQEEHFSFQPIQVIRGISELGYTSIDFLSPVPKDAKFVKTSAFFVAAELNKPTEHHH